MPKKKLEVCWSDAENAWILSGTAYDKRGYIRSCMDGRWDPERRAWLIPAQDDLPRTAADIEAQYRKLPYDCGSLSYRTHVRRQEIKENERRYDEMMKIVEEWKKFPLCEVTGESKTLRIDEACHSRGYNYYFVRGAKKDVETHVRERSIYHEMVRYEVDEVRNAALAITYFDTSG